MRIAELVPLQQVLRPGEQDVLARLSRIIQPPLAVVAQKPAVSSRVAPHRAGAQIAHHVVGGADRPAVIVPVHAVRGGSNAEPLAGAALRDQVVEVPGPGVVIAPGIPLRGDPLRLEDHRVLHPHVCSIPRATAGTIGPTRCRPRPARRSTHRSRSAHRSAGWPWPGPAPPPPPPSRRSRSRPAAGRPRESRCCRRPAP